MTRLNCMHPFAIGFFSILFCFTTLSSSAQIDTTVFNAIKKCDINALQKSIKFTNINAVDSNGANALMWAVYYCDVPTVGYLVANGAKAPDSGVIYFKDDESPSPFYGNIQSIAADKGKIMLLQYFSDSLALSLDEKGFNPISQKKDEHGPLLWALAREHWDIVSYLLQKNRGKLGNKADYFINTTKELSRLQTDKPDLKDRIALQNFILELAKEYFGENDIDYARALSRVGFFFWTIDEYHKGLAAYEQAFFILKNSVAEDQLHESMNNLAVFYYLTGKYDKALPLYKQAINTIKKIKGENNRDYALYLLNTATAYAGMGRYDEALPLLQQSLAINKTLVGDEHPDYVRILSNMANIYARMGVFDKAVTLHTQALAIRKKTFGEEDINYARSLHGVAYAFVEMGLYDKAIPLFNQAIPIYKKVFGEQHPEYAGILHNFGALYSRMGQYTKALPLNQQAAQLRKKILGELHPEYAAALSNLALAYWNTGRNDTAQALFEQVVTIIEKILGMEHPEYGRTLRDLSAFYISSGKSKLALPLIIKANQIELNYLTQTYSTLSEQEKIKLLVNRGGAFFYLPSFIFSGAISDSIALIQLYQNELTLKGIALESQQEVMNTIRNSHDDAAIKLYDLWKFNNQFIAKQVLLPMKNRVAYLDSLQEATNQQEQALSRYSAAFQNQQKNKKLTVKDVAQRLSRKAAAIEFVRFRVYRQQRTDSLIYAALILLPNDSVPKFIPLFEEKQLLQLLQSPYKNISAYSVIQNLYSVKQSNNQLYNLIWKPIEKYLQDIKNVYYAPTGLLHKIAFSALQIDDKHTLIDKYHLSQVLSTRSVANPVVVAKKPQSASVWGNIQYDESSTINTPNLTRGTVSADSIISAFNLYTSDTRGTRGAGWRPLPSTKVEVESLRSLFAKNLISTKTFTAASATEENFKSISGNSPQVLHLATHGFFLPVQETKNNETTGATAFSVQQNPMFRSGLVLAGGNKTWKGEPFLNRKEDGILTAFEIAQMDLSKTDLVVLSACETALGDLQGNEGVIGLQRALKMAGVKQMILSLWQVPDKATMELMTLFYKNWLGGQTTRNALISAQLQLKKKHPSPYFWAAFVLVE